MLIQNFTLSCFLQFFSNSKLLFNISSYKYININFNSEVVISLEWKASKGHGGS